MDRLTSMAVFVKVVDLGSFTAVANALDLSGPMIGKHVRFLEERLGVRLLNRSTRRQSLTEFGRTYYERCRIVLAEAQAADDLAADQFSEPQGKLRVTMPALLGRRCVTPILLNLVQQYPKLELNLYLSDRIADLAEGNYDIAIRTGDLEDRSGVIARRIASHRMVVCASPSYIEFYGKPRHIEDIEKHQAIIYRRPGWVHPWLFPRNDQPVAQITPIGRLSFDDLEAIAEAATAGMGLAWLPSWLIRERVEAGSLIPLLSDQPDYIFNNYAMWLHMPHLPLKVRLAVDALALELPKVMA